MGYKAEIRAMEASQRRQQREAQKRLRELERQEKEQAKLSAIEQARLEVETFESRLEVLLSVHKEQGEPWNWIALAASLPPPCPQRTSYHEYKAKQQVAVMPSHLVDAARIMVEQARSRDDDDFRNASQSYADQTAQLEKLKNLARRILAGEHRAYLDALIEINPFAEMSHLGSSIYFTVHTTKLIECVLKVKGKQAIPEVNKTLTTGGKVSVKPMPKGRFQEIYQDYLCGCVLRVAREIFALLPIDELLVSAAADALDTRTGHAIEMPVMSAFIPRSTVARLDFDRLNASDAIDNFQHRGDFRASRKSESFQAIIPLTPANITRTLFENMGFQTLIAGIQKMREELKSQIAELRQQASEASPQTGPSP
jgi:hypothetical protein